MKTATANKKKNEKIYETSCVICTGPITKNEKTFWKICFYPKAQHEAKYQYTVFSQEKSTTLAQKIASDQNCELIIHNPSEN